MTGLDAELAAPAAGAAAEPVRVPVPVTRALSPMGETFSPFFPFCRQQNFLDRSARSASDTRTLPLNPTVKFNLFDVKFAFLFFYIQKVIGQSRGKVQLLTDFCEFFGCFDLL